MIHEDFGLEPPYGKGNSDDEILTTVDFYKAALRRSMDKCIKEGFEGPKVTDLMLCKAAVNCC